MRKLIYLLLVFIHFCFSEKTTAQNDASVIYKYYSYGNYSCDMKLTINNGTSKFTFQTKDTTTYGENTMEFYHYFSYFETYYNLLSKEVTEIRILNKDESNLIAHWQNHLVWNITGETKQILGYTVQKAIVKAYGYTDPGSEFDYGDAIAWFTTEIPFQTGPERYFGLPGLILEVEFTQRRMKYVAQDIDFSPTEKINFPTQGIEVSMKETVRPFLIDKKWLKQKQKEFSASK